MDTISSRPVPGPEARPLLALEKEELLLFSPHGNTTHGALALTNRGDAPLTGSVTVRVGGEWLRATPATLYVPPKRTIQLEVQANPAALPRGYARGEIAIVTNGGMVSVPVRVGVRMGRLWRLLAGALGACAIVAVLAGIVLAGLQTPRSAPAPAKGPTVTARHSGAGTLAVPSPTPVINGEQALRDIRRAIADSYAVWKDALTIASSAALPSVEADGELARVTAEVQELSSNGEQWQIEDQGFHVLDVSVGGDGRSGTGEVERTERRALYGPDHPSVPYQVSDATYRLRYHLVQRGGRWLVDDVTVLAVTPHAAAAPLATVQEVALRVSPVVVHVEADGVDGGTAVGTGIILRSDHAASYIVTNDHVVHGAGAVRLQRWLHNARTNLYEPTPATPWLASRVWEDQANDLAVIRIDQGNLPVATWGDSTALQPGQQVVAIGYAEDLSGGPTVTNGIVSNLQRTSPDNPSGPTYIQHSATINPGNSGGPLADMNGHVVGINTWTLGNTQGLFFAIPSTRILRVTANIVGTNG